MYAINSSSNIIGNNGEPLLNKIDGETNFWVYSTLQLKTKYPGEHPIEEMTEEDVNSIVASLGGDN